MDLNVTVATNIGEISSLKQQSIMNLRPEIERLFPDGVNVDVNQDRITILFQNVDSNLLKDIQFSNNIGELFILMLNKLLIEKYSFFEIIYVDLLSEKINFNKQEQELKELDINLLGEGKEYRYRDDKFEIRFKYEPNYTNISEKNIYKNIILGSKHQENELKQIKHELETSFEKISSLDGKLFYKYINENEWEKCF